MSVIDLEGGHQPLSNEDGSIWIAFNGEIYNHNELRSDLKRRGHRFITKSDTEVLVHAYEEFGRDCPKRLNGMFAFAIWDSNKNRFFAARDRLGQKPLYYSHINDLFVFGSELKALLKVPAVPREIDEVALHHYLSLQYIPEPRSIYRRVRKLPAAHWICYEGNELAIERYWNLQFEPKLDIPEREAIEELRRILKEAVKRRLLSDVPLGAFLSGGIDSSIIVGLMAEMSPTPVRTFSIGFSFESMNELPHARSVADKWNTDHHEFVVTPERFDDILPKLTDAFDEPFADSSAYQTFLLSRETRRHVTVALNGDGGDECFAGYPRYWLDRWVRPYTALPRVVTQRLVPALLRHLPEPNQEIIEANWVLGLKRLAQVARSTPKASIIRWGSFFDEDSKRELYTPDFSARLGDEDTCDLLATAFDMASARTSLDRTLAVDTGNYLCGDILVKSDRTTMSNSLEARSPFLDHELVEFAAKLPLRLKLRGRRGKYLLRTAFRNHTPENILERPKRGFAAPIEAWLREELRPAVHDLVLSPDSELRPYFCQQTIAKLVREHESRVTDHGRRIWALLMLESWFRHRNTFDTISRLD